MSSWSENAWQYVLDKIERTHARIGDSFPLASYGGKYDDREPHCWTNGFWPGILWTVYRETKDERLRGIAESCEAKMDVPLQQYVELHHDNGFMWSLSSVANFKLTGNPQSRIRGLIAASHLASRFNLKGHFIRAWLYEGSEGLAIIDCMMNLGLLYWASEQLGDPRYRHIAHAHAEMTLNSFVDEDGAVRHIVRFDPETGERLEALGGQGFGPASAWSRGAAWAIYGFAGSYRYTKDERFLAAAKKTADFFLKHLPDDLVPPWDFRAPEDQIWAKDSTAAACAASGMLEIAALCGLDDGERYRNAGEAILKSLYENCTPEDPAEEALIVKGTGSFPSGYEVETPIIYGDFFFVEGIAKLRGNQEVFW